MNKKIIIGIILITLFLITGCSNKKRVDVYFHDEDFGAYLIINGKTLPGKFCQCILNNTTIYLNINVIDDYNCKILFC